MKRLYGQAADFSPVEEPGTSVAEDIDSDLKQKLLQAKDDLSNGKVFSTEEVLEMIEQGEI